MAPELVTGGHFLRLLRMVLSNLSSLKFGDEQIADRMGVSCLDTDAHYESTCSKS